jgi:hypothetical protein
MPVTLVMGPVNTKIAIKESPKVFLCISSVKNEVTCDCIKHLIGDWRLGIPSVVILTNTVTTEVGQHSSLHLFSLP